MMMLLEVKFRFSSGEFAEFVFGDTRISFFCWSCSRFWLVFGDEMVFWLDGCEVGAVPLFLCPIQLACSSRREKDSTTFFFPILRLPYPIRVD